MTGTLTQVGDRWQLRFVRTPPYPPEQVWRAVTEPEHLRAWFPQTIVGDWAVGNEISYVSDMDSVADWTGTVLGVESPRVLEFTWGSDVLRIEIAPDGAGCELVFTDTFDEVGRAARDAAGWHVCLERLDHDLAGTDPAWDIGERWQQVHPSYVAELGPRASTIGPPAGVR